MGFDLNGTTLTSDSGLVATHAADQVMKMGPTGILQRYNAGQPMFRAGGQYADWWGIGTNAWQPVPGLATTNVNTGSCYTYAGSNGRFTAPVDGLYLFTASAYLLIGSAGGYAHPQFYVNGSEGNRRIAVARRIRGHGITAGYSHDTDIFEMIPLIAGDYVELWAYSGTTIYHYPLYARFEGVLLF